jgi:hypothetical protein
MRDHLGVQPSGRLRGTREWRPSSGLRVAAVLVLGFAGWVSAKACAAARADGELWEGVAFSALLFLPPAALLVLHAFRARITVDDDGVEVVSMFSTRRVPWTEIQGVSAGYWGITLHLADGTSLTATAAQRSNWAAATGADTTADEVVYEIANRSGLPSTTADRSGDPNHP